MKFNVDKMLEGRILSYLPPDSIKALLVSDKIETYLYQLPKHPLRVHNCECRDLIIGFAYDNEIFMGKHDAFKQTIFTSFKMFKQYVEALLYANKFNNHLGDWYGQLPLARGERILLAMAPDGSLLIQYGVKKKPITLNLHPDLKRMTNCLQLAFKN